MKRILSYLFILISNLIYAQSTFIYVDVSGDVNRTKLVDRVEYEISGTKDIIYFISNDNSPLIGKGMNNLNQDLTELGLIKPSMPASYKEVDTLLSVLNGAVMPINLSFYLDYEYAVNEGVQNLIGRLLLSSGWQNKNGLIADIKVRIYIQSREQLTQNQLNDLSKKGIYEVITY